MANNSVNTRELIMDMLLALEDSREQSHILLKNVLDKYDYLPVSDKSFIKRVLTGTLEYRIKLDYIIDCFSKTPVKKMKPVIRNIMRMSVYQLLFMDKVPDSAVCNEAVKLAGKRGFKGLQGFVNGVLRGIIRGRDSIKYPDINSSEKEEAVYGISIAYSCPEIVVESLLEDYGIQRTLKVLEAALNSRNIYIRTNETLSEKELKNVLSEWQQAGIEFEQSLVIPYAYKIFKADKLPKLKGFMEGAYTVQDLSSMFVCEMADIAADDLVLDICAAPGGKSLHAAQKQRVAMDKRVSENGNIPEQQRVGSLAQIGASTDGQENNIRKEVGKLLSGGKIISRDLTEYKVSLIRENIERLKISNIDTQVWDARVFDEKMEQRADVVIADVPCSGFGVMGRKPDIKYNITSEGLSSLIELQRRIIDNAVRYVKPNGTLMYSTCTMRKAENEENVRYILDKYDYELMEEKQLFLSEDNDGFYIAKLRRNK